MAPRSSSLWLPPAVAAIIFALAFDSGAFSLQSRTFLAVVVWWSILVLAALGLWPVARPPRATLVVGGLLALYAAWTLISLLWSPSAERTFVEFDRAILYLGVYVLVVLASTPGTFVMWCDGLALGTSAVGLLALASRLFPNVFPEGEVPEVLPAAAARLSWPVEYWNGLAILVALGVPFLLRLAVEGRREFTRVLAFAGLPALAATIYLTSSRGAVAAALLGGLTFLVLADRHWGAAGALLLAGLGAALAVALVAQQDALVNGPLGSDEAASQGARAALLLLLVCAVTALVAFGGGRALRGVQLPSLPGRLVTIAGLVLAVGVIALSSPGERFDEFKEPPPAASGPDFVQSHLTSGSGTGRWQYWTAAIGAFETAPVHGRGAGSYEAWWTQERTIDQPVDDAHSLYLETLGELGLVGFALLAGAVGIGGVVGVRRALRGGLGRTTVAAAVGGLVAYLFAAGIDWMWELTVVSVVGFVCLALVTGPASATAPPPAANLRHGGGLGRATFIAALLAVWLLIVAQAIPLLAETKLHDSQAAARRGDFADAASDAGAARSLQPWAASPYFQLALVEEEAGDLEAARRWMGEALERDSDDWMLWVVNARILTKSGDIEEARASLARARDLNPRSPLVANDSRR